MITRLLCRASRTCEVYFGMPQDTTRSTHCPMTKIYQPIKKTYKVRTSPNLNEKVVRFSVYKTGIVCLALYGVKAFFNNDISKHFFRSLMICAGF